RVPRSAEPIGQHVYRAISRSVSAGHRRSGSERSDGLAGSGESSPATSGVTGLLRCVLAGRRFGSRSRVIASLDEAFRRGKRGAPGGGIKIGPPRIRVRIPPQVGIPVRKREPFCRQYLAKTGVQSCPSSKAR